MTDSRLLDVLQGREGNYLLPFYWQRGDHCDKIPEQVARIRASGCRALCVESRPHPDFCGTVAEGRQLFMTVGLAKNDEIWGDMRRVTGEKSQDLFNIVAIDTYLKHIRVFRVGAEWSRFLQHRTTMCLDYAARKQVN